MSHRILAVALAVLMISFATPPIAFDAQKGRLSELQSQ